MPTFKELFISQGVSLEGAEADGKLQREIEHTFYAELEDLEQLKKLALRVDRHEQWLIPVAESVAKKGKARIRLVNNQQAILTVKVKPSFGEGDLETEQDISKDMFNALKVLGVGGYYKTRYTLATSIPKVYWEVDVFFGNGGMEHPWVKVDLEVKSLQDPVPKFPIDVREYIDPRDDLGYTSKTKIKNLWEKEWQQIDPQYPEG